MAKSSYRVGQGNRNTALAGRSWLYFARAGEGLVKIGRTRQLAQRLHALNAASPEPVVLLGTIPETWLTEAEVHDRFGKHRVRGEWFEPVPEILALAEAGNRVFATGYVDTTDDDAAWAAIKGLSA